MVTGPVASLTTISPPSTTECRAEPLRFAAMWMKSVPSPVQDIGTEAAPGRDDTE